MEGQQNSTPARVEITSQHFAPFFSIQNPLQQSELRQHARFFLCVLLCCFCE